MRVLLLAFIMLASAMCLGLDVIRNGGFETGGDRHEFWTQNDGGGPATFSIDTTVKRSGKASARLTVGAHNKTFWPAYETVIEHPSSDLRYKAVIYVKCRCTPETVTYAAFEFQDENGKRISVAQSSMISGSTEDWRKLILSGAPPPGTRKMALRLILFGVGTAWFDDISVTAIDPVAAGKITFPVVGVKITDKVVNGSFLGIGAETDPWLMNQENRSKGVTGEDAALIDKRIESMGMSFARVFVWWSAWNPSADRKTFVWDSDGMKSLYRQLDTHQRLGIPVLICGVEWGSKPYDEPVAAAKAIGALLEQLVIKKGYTCIRFWTLLNEPNNSWIQEYGYSFDRYIEMHRLVIEEMKRLGIRDRILVSTADESGGFEWFSRTVKEMHAYSDAYITHTYAPSATPEEATESFMMRLDAMKKYDPEYARKKLILGEFGFIAPDQTDRKNPFMRTHELGILISSMLIDDLSLGMDAASIWCLYRVNYPGFNFMDFGLWEFKDEQWKPRPVYFAYRLFTRFCRPGSRVLEAQADDTGGLVKCVAVKSTSNTALYIVNNANNDAPLAITTGLNGGTYQCYRYTEASVTEDPLVWKPALEGQTTAVMNDTLPAKTCSVYVFTPGK